MHGSSTRRCYRGCPGCRSPAPSAGTGHGRFNRAGVRVAVVDSGIENDHPAVGRVDGAVALPTTRRRRTRSASRRVRTRTCSGTAPPAPASSARSRRMPAVQRAGPRGAGSPAGPPFSQPVCGGRQRRNCRWSMCPQHEPGRAPAAAPRDRRHRVFHPHGAGLRGQQHPRSSYPAQFAAVLSVAAHERRDPFGFDYNPSPPVEFGAPVLDVEVAWRGGGTLTMTGNSFAAAHITGLVARLLGKHPDLTPFPGQERCCTPPRTTRPGEPRRANAGR